MLSLRPTLRVRSLLLRGYASAPATAPPHAALPPTAPESANPSTPVPASIAQAPNYPTTWSPSQNPRAAAMSGPRFEQTDFRLQAQPFSAMQAVSEEPVRLVNGRKATCDGGGGPLGHPKIFINLDKPGPKACGYCGIRFEQAHHH